MCHRDHKPESYTLCGMEVVVCDDLPADGGWMAVPRESIFEAQRALEACAKAQAEPHFSEG